MTRKDLIGKRLKAGRSIFNIKDCYNKAEVYLYTNSLYYCSYSYEILIYKVKNKEWSLLGSRNIKLHEYLRE